MNRGGRPRTGHVALPAVRLPGELYKRLARRLKILRIQGEPTTVSEYVRRGLTKLLDNDDRAEKRALKKRTPRGR